MHPDLILASTSRYRRQLLERLDLPFEVAAPECDETPQPGETPQALAIRLARQKAQSLARHFPRAWIIGSDQVAWRVPEPVPNAESPADMQPGKAQGSPRGEEGHAAHSTGQARRDGVGLLLKKPGTLECATRQLAAMRRQTVIFHTAVALHRPAEAITEHRLSTWRIRMRDYSDAEIDDYLQRESPLDCAGSLKTEGLGVSLIAEMHGDDPAAIIGLPLVALCEMLRAQGYPVP